MAEHNEKSVSVDSFTKKNAMSNGDYIMLSVNGNLVGITYADVLAGLASGVTSFKSRSGAVDPATGDYTSDQVSEGVGNLYFSNERAQDAIGAALASDFSYNDAANSIGLRLRSVANPTRTLNTAFQISTDRDAIVAYSVDTACALSLSGGQQGTVYLRYADDSAHTTNVKEVCRFVNGNTGTLTIGLAITQNATGSLSGIVPAGKYGKIVTENNVGTPVFTYRSSQEVLL